MKKLLSNAVINTAIIIFFTSLTLSFVIILIIINRNIVVDKENIDLFDLFVKSSFALIGSSISGFVAFMIFYLGDRKKDQERIKYEQNLLSKIIGETDNNLEVFKEVHSILKKGPINDTVELLHREQSKIKESLLIFFTKLDFSILESSLKDISETDYTKYISRFRKQKVIYNYLELLLTQVQHKENTKILIERINIEIALLSMIEQELKKDNATSGPTQKKQTQI